MNAKQKRLAAGIRVCLDKETRGFVGDMNRQYFSARLLAWRKSVAGRTQASAAAALGVKLRTYQAWEAGIRRPTGLGLRSLEETISARTGKQRRAGGRPMRREGRWCCEKNRT